MKQGRVQGWVKKNNKVKVKVKVFAYEKIIYLGWLRSLG